MKIIISLVLTLLTVQLTNASEVTSKVQKIGSSWEADKACIYLVTGDVIKVDLNTQKGMAELSIGLSAKATDSNLYVYFHDANPLSGGCNTGTTIKQHGIITMH